MLTPKRCWWLGCIIPQTKHINIGVELLSQRLWSLILKFYHKRFYYIIIFDPKNTLGSWVESEVVG